VTYAMSTMQEHPLLVSTILRHGARVHHESNVYHYQSGATTTITFAQMGDRAERLAGGLQSIGIDRGDVVAALLWNTPEYLTAYYAVPGIGAVLHTLNLRMTEDQLAHILNQGGSKAVIVEPSLIELLEKVLDKAPTVEHILIVGDATVSAPEHVTVHSYAKLVENATPVDTWPEFDERSAAILCYTSGTTGMPKGVAYSHRSIYLQALTSCTGNAYGLTDGDRLLPAIPLFHANAWGWPFGAFLSGADLILTDRHLQAPHLATMLHDLQPTAMMGVPTIWNDLIAYGETEPVDVSSLRLAGTGGSNPTPALLSTLRTRYGLLLVQGWGMTEGTLAAWSLPSRRTSPVDELKWVAMSGRLSPGVEVRIVDENGDELPWDGVSTGEAQLRGNWIAAAYLGGEERNEKFQDGWLRTGDAATVGAGGWVQIRDRLKDGIKSGGEWISSIEIQDALLRHPSVREAAVIGVPHPKWDERPAAYVVPVSHTSLDPEELRSFLSEHVAKWWVPEDWLVVSEIPRTSVGKLDKNRLRELHRDIAARQ
jgi:fatty-acyl-CoA synthase